jgi:predicted transcriptional regulator
VIRVLLSIKPEYAELIFNGTKRFEFRKRIFKSKDITRIVVYASSPVKKVIGEFDIDYILKDQIDILWNKTKESAGIEKEYFDQYFCNHEEGYAVAIKKVHKYKTTLDLKETYNVIPPQSFMYLN